MNESSADDVRRRVRRIIRVGRRLPPEVYGDIIDLDADAIPALLEILENRELSLAKSPGDGWAPAHAAGFLGELRAAAAVEPMLRVLADTDGLDVLQDAIVRSLPEIGAPVVEPALRAHGASTDRDLRSSLAAILARARVRDERILTLLLEHLQLEPDRAAGALADYGDEAALPALRRAFDDYEIVESESPLANQALVELDAAIEELGGTLSPGQREKLRRGMEPADRFRRMMDEAMRAHTFASRRVRPGRNEPCWCGSPKKYKKCHLAADEAGETTPTMTAEI